MAQLMPLTVSCFGKIKIGFSFLVPAHPGSPGQRAVKRVCVCVRACACVYRRYLFDITQLVILRCLCHISIDRLINRSADGSLDAREHDDAACTMTLIVELCALLEERENWLTQFTRKTVVKQEQ